MSAVIAKSALDQLRHEHFQRIKERTGRLKNDDAEVSIDLANLPGEALEELEALASDGGDRRLSRVLKVFRASRAGDFSHPIPNFKVAPDVISDYLGHELIDGWIYVEQPDGSLLPELILSIREEAQHGTSRERLLAIRTLATSGGDDRDGPSVRARKNCHLMNPSDVTNKTPQAALAQQGLHKETPELKKQFESEFERHVNEIMGRFAEQFTFTGRLAIRDWRIGGQKPLVRRKVIHDLEKEDFGPVVAFATAEWSKAGAPDDCERVIPFHPLIRVFDLKSHHFYWVNSKNLTAYQYDRALGSKLILPATHRDLLDVLTTDLETFSGDLVEGKGTGNVLLCTGAPGVGKTLTAEVYTETLGQPLYSIHSGSLGTNASTIREQLETVFTRARRWGCVLLLDEADVFVSVRGGSIEQNAICAEFLRTLEYFDGLLFMTTNRHDDIDDAILSRCLAVIRYGPPSTEDAPTVWSVLSEAVGNRLPPELIDDLVRVFPRVVGRDIKQLCGTVFRMAKAGRWNIDLDGFRKAAMFRGVEMMPEGAEKMIPENGGTATEGDR